MYSAYQTYLHTSMLFKCVLYSVILDLTANRLSYMYIMRMVRWKQASVKGRVERWWCSYTESVKVKRKKTNKINVNSIHCKYNSHRSSKPI